MAHTRDKADEEYAATQDELDRLMLEHVVARPGFVHKMEKQIIELILQIENGRYEGESAIRDAIDILRGKTIKLWR